MRVCKGKQQGCRTGYFALQHEAHIQIKCLRSVIFTGGFLILRLGRFNLSHLYNEAAFITDFITYLSTSLSLIYKFSVENFHPQERQIYDTMKHGVVMRCLGYQRFTTPRFGCKHWIHFYFSDLKTHYTFTSVPERSHKILRKHQHVSSCICLTS